MTTSRRLLVYVVPAFIVAGIWFVASWNADASDVEASTARFESAVADRVGASRDLATATAFRDGGEAALARLDALRTAVPEEPAVSDFVLINGDAAERAGVVISELTPQAQGATTAVGPRGTEAIGIDMSASGTQSAVDAYLGELKSLGRTIAVDDVTISPLSDATVEVRISGRIFHLADPESDSAGASAGISAFGK